MNKKAKTKAQKADEDANLDEALDEFFPGSDPPSMTQPRTGADVTQRKPKRHPKGEATHHGTKAFPTAPSSARGPRAGFEQSGQNNPEKRSAVAANCPSGRAWRP